MQIVIQAYVTTAAAMAMTFGSKVASVGDMAFLELKILLVHVSFRTCCFCREESFVFGLHESSMRILNHSKT